MSDREITLFDLSKPDAKADTTHIEARVRHHSSGDYVLYVSPYTLPFADDPGLRRYPLSAGRAALLDQGRFSQKKLAALAANPATITRARQLAGLE